MLLDGYGLRAQQQPASADATTSTADSAPRTIRIEAIVTDKHGAPIANLRPGDFAITDNGVAQKVDAADWRSNAPPAVGPIAPPGEINDDADERRAAREAGTRLIALYLDEYHVSAGESTERVRHAVSRFIDEQVRPNDLLAVMKPLDHLSEIRFTRDRDVARQVVSSFNGRRNDYTPRTPFEEQYLGRSPGAVRAARAQIVMSGVRAVATRMGELNGPLGGIVVMSEGFTTDVPRARERRLPDLQGLVRAASRFRVLLYAFDPRATPPPAPDAVDGDSPVESLSVLQSVARQTGGDALVAGQDLVPALQRVSSDLDSYYVLTFTSTSPSDGRFHALQITSKRRDTQIRTRAGYWAPLQSDLRTTRLALPAVLPTRPLRRSPLIDSWLGQTVQPDGQRRIIFTWTPAAAPVSSRTKMAVRPDVVALKVTTSTGTVLVRRGGGAGASRRRLELTAR